MSYPRKNRDEPFDVRFDVTPDGQVDGAGETTDGTSGAASGPPGPSPRTAPGPRIGDLTSRGRRRRERRQGARAEASGETASSQPVRPGAEPPRQIAPRSKPPLPEDEPPAHARPTVHEQVVALPTDDMFPAAPENTPVDGLRENAPPSSPQPPQRGDVPPAVTVRPEGPGEHLSILDLPKLQPASPAGQGSAAPDVTVNIGRIEVVRPTPEPRTAPPERRRARSRAPGAPDLADYLRERKSR